MAAGAGGVLTISERSQVVTSKERVESSVIQSSSAASIFESLLYISETTFLVNLQTRSDRNRHVDVDMESDKVEAVNGYIKDQIMSEW